MEEQGEKSKMEGEMEEKDGGRGEMWRRWKMGGKGGIGVHVEGWEGERGIKNRGRDGRESERKRKRK